MTGMPRSVGALGGVILLGSLASCGVLSGLSDLQIYDVPDGGAPEGDGASPSDGVAGCKPTGTIEVCEDGIDNDCNGLIDCADAACNATFQCVPEPPQGWTVAAASLTSAPACPPLVPTAQDILTASGDSASSCACTCESADPACSKGTYTFSFGTACGTSATLDPTIACGAVTAQLAKDSELHLAGPPPPSTCAPSLKKTIAAPQKGRLCQGAPIGHGCASGTICVPRVAPPLQSCITETGDRACPNTYPAKSFAGSGVQSDTRDCTACTCQSGTCTGSATFYEGPNCNGRTVVVASALTCTTPGNDAIGASSYALGQFGGGCDVAQKAALTGTLTLADQRTICCRP
jgi:hypothetical protein